ncbi:hypothetical protein WDW86_16235 [Bdellovibrionota bacterium FG-2]
MQKRSFDFFGRAPVSGANLCRIIVISLGLTVHGGGVCPFAFAVETQPSGIPSPSAAGDADFLSAPSFELEREPLASAKPQVPQVGDVLRLNVQGYQGSSAAIKVEASVPVDKLREEGFEILPNPAASSVPLSISVVIVKAGKLTLPALGLRDSASKWVGRTNPFSLEVTSSIRSDDPQPEKPAEGLPPVALGFPWKLIVAAGLLVFALVALGVYAGVRWSRPGRMSKQKVSEGPPKPEDEVALAELERLEREGFLKIGRFKPHYFRVSDILKAYFGRRFDFDALESTSGELMIALERKQVVSEELLREIRLYFDNLDEVKFTDRPPLPDAAGKLVAQAREFVLKTRRIAQIAQPPVGGQA